MPKGPYCKQVVTLDKTRRESADVSVPDGVQRDVSGLVKNVRYWFPFWESAQPEAQASRSYPCLHDGGQFRSGSFAAADGTGGCSSTVDLSARRSRMPSQA